MGESCAFPPLKCTPCFVTCSCDDPVHYLILVFSCISDGSHKNDGFSQPKIAWSNNGQYLYGNTQDENMICVWDIASSSIVKKLENSHTQAIRDLYSSSLLDTLVSTSFDKKTNLYFSKSD